MKWLLVAVIVALPICAANAGLLDAIATDDWKMKKTNRYKLSVYGYDARAYEFDTDNGMKCLMVFPGGSATGWQMQCLPK